MNYEYLTVRQFSDLHHVNYYTVHFWIKRKAIETYCPAEGVILIPVSQKEPSLKAGRPKTIFRDNTLKPFIVKKKTAIDTCNKCGVDIFAGQQVFKKSLDDQNSFCSKVCLETYDKQS